MSKILKTIPFTTQKYKEMQKIVTDLEAECEVVMKRLITAREMGDLSENGAYKYAKFELGNIGRQLTRYKNLLAKGFPAPKNTNAQGLIDFGSVVTVQKDTDDEEKQKTFMIVSEHESDPSQGKIAYSSPLGKALMRKKIGEKVEVETPNGKTIYFIKNIK